MLIMKPSSNRNHVIAIASELFLQKGLANTSMDEVVVKSGVSKSNIYYHFKSKEDLVVAVFDYRINRLRETLDELSGSVNRSIAKRIELIFTALAEELEDRSCVGGCPIFSLLSAQIPEIRTRINHFIDEMQALVERLLVAGVVAGEFRADIPIAQTATMIVTTLEGAMMLAESRGNAEGIRNAGETLLHLLKV